MFGVLELYFLFTLVILLYIAFSVTYNTEEITASNKGTKAQIAKMKNSNFLSHISSRTSILTLFVFVLLLMVVMYFFITKPETSKIQLDVNNTYVKKFYAGFTNNVRVYVRPLTGTCTVDLLYGYDKTDEKVSQCQWISKSDDVQTNSFVNDALGSYYELRITPSTKTKVLTSISKGNNMNVYHTPHNAIIAPINVAHSRIVEIVPQGTSYALNEKSSVFDFGSSHATNIEINASCSNASEPYLTLFGSDVNEDSKFIRITEIVFNDGSKTALNSKYYLDQVSLSHHRYYYIQVTKAAATDLYVKITRRNY